MRHRRRTLTFLLILLVGLGTIVPSLHQPAIAQDATPAANLPRPDIAAMTLIPADLPQPGYGLESGNRLTIEEEARSAVAYRGGERAVEDVADFAVQLRNAGWRERYVTVLALPAAADPGRVERRIVSYVTLYADARGAEQGFALMEDESAVPTAEDVPGSRTLGAQSEITRDTGTIVVGDQPYQSIDLTFRLDTLTAGVLIYDNRNLQPEIAEVEALATTLLARIQTVLATGGPGLGPRALRLGGAAETIVFDEEGYELLGDTLVPYVGEAPDIQAVREVNYGVATDVYAVYQALVNGDAEPNDDPYLVARLYRFANDAAASQWLAGLPDQLRAAPEEYADVTALTEGVAVGDESLALAYAFQASDTLVTRGYLLAVRIGPVVARIQIDALPEPSLTVVRTLAETQAVCLADPSGAACPETVPIPPELLQPVAVATPAATPAAPVVPPATPTA